MSQARSLSLLRRLAQLQRAHHASRIDTSTTTSAFSSSLRPLPPGTRAAQAPTPIAPAPPQAASFASVAPAAATAGTTAPTTTTNRLTAAYDALVARGALLPDANQRAVLQRLAQLLDEVDAYAEAHAQHAAEDRLWRGKAAQRLGALEEAEREQDDREAQEAAAAAAEAAAAAATTTTTTTRPSPTSPTPGWLSWLLPSATMASSPPSPHDHLPPESPASAAARVRRARAERRAARVRAELGPPPSPPPAPRGVYIYGGVGSGKTLLMDLFFAAAAGREGLENSSSSSEALVSAAATMATTEQSRSSSALRHARRLHFNAAMIELHQRLHSVEKERRRRLQEQVEEDKQADDHHDDDDDDQDDDQDAATATAMAESHARQIERTVRDAEARRAKAARSAVLAVRRHLRRQRLGRVSEAALASSDADVMRRAVRSLIRGGGARGDGDDGDASSSSAGALVALDEMQAPDPFAVVFARSLVKALHEERSVIVATSNRSPWDLPSAGLHETLHASFVDGLVGAVDVVCLGAGGQGGEAQPHVDYRRVALERSLAALARGGEEEDNDSGLVPPVVDGGDARRGRSSSYFWPLGSAASAAMDARWAEIGGGKEEEAPFVLNVGWGRSMAVSRWKRAEAGTPLAARFSFNELCADLLGPSDYAALASTFDFLFVDNVPLLSMRQRDKARRFITLVDEAYNHNRVLVVSAAASPEALFAGCGGGGGGNKGGEKSQDDDDEPLLDLEQLQFETAAEDARLRRDVTREGGVAPVASTDRAKAAAASVLGGEEEKFAFARAASRLLEMAAR